MFDPADIMVALTVGLAVGIALGATGVFVLVTSSARRRAATERRRLVSTQRLANDLTVRVLELTVSDDVDLAELADNDRHSKRVELLSFPA